MVVSLGTGLTVLTLFVSLLILTVGAWNLYLSHYREGRSEIDLLPEDSSSKPEFTGGSHAIDRRAFWTGFFYLKVVNSGEKGAYISSTNHSLQGLKRDDQVSDPENVTLEVRRSSRSWVGTEIEPRSSKRYRISVRIATETDIGVFVDNDSAIVRHTFEVEDNEGSYEVTYNTEIKLTGPEAAIENWEEHQRKESDG
jgi:hypothetical protein